MKVCRSGNRSKNAARILAEKGYQVLEGCFRQSGCGKDMRCKQLNKSVLT